MKVDEAEYQSRGLRSRHAYSLLDVRDIDGHRLLQLRNPWGHYVWTGDWSDNSSKWTEDLRYELMPNGPPHDGTFWISFSDVLKYFDCIDICKARSNWNEIRLSGILPPLSSQQHLSCILLTVLEPTEVDFTLFQVRQLFLQSKIVFNVFLRKDKGNRKNRKDHSWICVWCCFVQKTELQILGV